MTHHEPEPLHPSAAPDPTKHFERSDPQRESPGGKLIQKRATPVKRPDRPDESVAHRQKPSTDLDTDVEPSGSHSLSPDDQIPDQMRAPMVDEAAIAGDMKSEEPDGWDQAPTDIHDPRQQRHPRPDGVGGLIPNRNTDH